MKLKKQERRNEIKKEIEKNPFITDLDLSVLFSVSIQTIRLDRTHLNIPELRKRIKLVAEQNYGRIKSIEANEIIGDLIQVNPDVSAQSLIEITIDSVFAKSEIARGHVLFAQANSLCVALINDELALTTKSNVQFKKSVKLNERVIAKATVIHKSKHIAKVDVTSTVHGETVFQGQFEMYYSSEGENNG